MKFLHLTDTHLLRPGERLYELDPYDRLRACVDDILSEHADAAFCVVTGDIADRGEEGAYGAFVDLVSALPMPVYALVGYHDDRAVFQCSLPDVAVDENGFIQSIVDSDEGRFVMLDTLDTGKSLGRYCSMRRAWLKKTLDSSHRRPVFLFMHHPPFDVGIPSLDRIGLVDKCEFKMLLSGRTNIRHLFFGHVHRPISGSWNGIPVSTLSATAHQVALDLVDYGALRFTHERPAYAVVMINEESVLIHHRDFIDPLPTIV